jgi:hypothetical protein
MPSGKYKGTSIEEVPPGYLRRLANGRGNLAAMAKKELARRKMELYSIEITAHAVDRASTRFGLQWAQTSNAGEGIHAWLGRVAEEALEKIDLTKERGSLCVTHRSMVFAFDLRFVTPVLTSVWLSNEKEETCPNNF